MKFLSLVSVAVLCVFSAVISTSFLVENHGPMVFHLVQMQCSLVVTVIAVRNFRVTAVKVAEILGLFCAAVLLLLNTWLLVYAYSLAIDSSVFAVALLVTLTPALWWAAFAVLSFLRWVIYKTWVPYYFIRTWHMGWVMCVWISLILNAINPNRIVESDQGVGCGTKAEATQS